MGHIAHEYEHVISFMMELGKKIVDIQIPPEARKFNAGAELGVQIGK